MIWTCPICKRNKFDRKYQSHNCIGGFRKHKFGNTMTKAELINQLINFGDEDLVMIFDEVNCELKHIESVACDSGSEESHSAVIYMSNEDADGNRTNLGLVPCEYCGEKDCNFDCDESQAGGFPL